MSQFNFNDYQNVVAQAEANANGNGTKVGYFKLKNDGDIAIARLNISSTDDLDFASVHTIGANGRWIKVSCLNPLGSYAGNCALCGAHNANPKGSVSKAAKKVFIQMMVSYRDATSATGYTAPAPVIWDRPAAFSRELANKLMIAGDLRNTLVLITRNGKAGDMQTTYSMDILPVEHPVFKPEMIPVDFSAFTNFNIAKHSYWEKTPEEINTFLTTGQFPEKTQQANAVPTTSYAVPNAAPASTPVMPAQPSTVTPNVQPTTFVVPAAAAPVQPAVSVTDTPVTPTTAGTETPARNFSGFSF